MKTIIDLPDPLYQSARHLALADGRSVAEFIAGLVGKVLAETTRQDLSEEIVEWREELLK